MLHHSPLSHSGHAVPRDQKKLCFTMPSFAPTVSTASLGMVKQSCFWSPGTIWPWCDKSEYLCTAYVSGWVLAYNMNNILHILNLHVLPNKAQVVSGHETVHSFNWIAYCTGGICSCISSAHTRVTLTKVDVLFSFQVLFEVFSSDRIPKVMWQCEYVIIFLNKGLYIHEVIVIVV